MGAVRRVFLTGASGFIGRTTVAAAHVAGFEVVAPTRSEVNLGSVDAAKRLAESMKGCDAVVHLAAAMGGDAAEHERVTVQGTGAVLDAMKRSDVDQLVLVSSLSVYSLEALEAGVAVTSESTLDSPETARDTYAAAKLKQEALAKAAGLPSLTILRPGIVYDETRLWNAHLGVGTGPVLFRFPKPTTLPMCHVTTLVGNILESVETKSTREQLVVDATLPARAQVIAALRKSGWPKVVLPFPWTLLRIVATLASSMSVRVPGLLRPRVLEQRMYPMGRVTSDMQSRWVRPEEVVT